LQANENNIYPSTIKKGTAMKTTLFTATLLVMFAASLYGQNINNTLGSGGTFTIKDGSTTFLSLSQSSGNLNLNKSLSLPATTGSSVGVIYKGAISFIHDFQVAGTNGFNMFVGVNSGNFTMSGTVVQASYNTAVGPYSLTSLTTGSFNSAFGEEALTTNTTGQGNAAFGYQTLRSNQSGNYNSAFGYTSLNHSITGSNNSAFGYQALFYNTGSENSAFGSWALNNSTSTYGNSAFGTSSLMANVTGNGNSAFGHQSLRLNTGSSNSAFGMTALFSNTIGYSNSSFGYCSIYSTTGNNNTAVGDSAGSSLTTGSNNTIVGSNAQVPSATSSNQVRIGNTAVTYAGIQVAWTITSDRRWKSNITGSDLGLEFVSKLRPVSYTRKNDSKNRSEYGFIAQDIEEVLNEAGVKNAGMLTVDDHGMYELRYNDLLAPMVKAIQELKAENDALKNQVLTLRSTIADVVKKEVQTALLRAARQEDVKTKVSLNETKN
jgi:hypothetical protein